jgi:hypothetical protein
MNTLAYYANAALKNILSRQGEAIFFSYFLGATTLSMTTLSLTTPSIVTFRIIVMLSVVYAKCL